MTLKTTTAFFSKTFFVVTLFIFSFNAYSLDMFLELEGIQGESDDVDYVNQIEVLAFSEGSSSSAQITLDGGGAVGRPNFLDISITKWLDASSPLLRLNLASGTLIPTATLTVVRGAGQERQVVFKIELSDVLISSVSSGGASGDDRLTENTSLVFAEITWTYIKYKDDGSEETRITRGWDLRENKAL